MGYLGAVVLVSWQVSAQIRLLVGESPNDQKQDQRKQDESLPGPQSHWKPEKQREVLPWDMVDKSISHH